MTKNSRTAAVIKGQISKYSGIISRDLPRPKQKLVREMIYGIQAAKDIKLSNITRSLNEPIPLIKTEDRLSRNLDDRDFTDKINNQICRLASRKVLEISNSSPGVGGGGKFPEDFEAIRCMECNHT